MGRPMAFATVEELQQGIDAYFAEEAANGYPVTVSGLAYALGVDRKTIHNYSNDDEFFPTIKKAIAFIEADKVKKMLKGEYNTTGAIFDLKNNHDWKDQQHIQANNKQEHSIAPDTLDAVEQAAKNVAEILNSTRS